MSREAARLDKIRTTRTLQAVHNGEDSNCGTQVLREFGIEDAPLHSYSMNEIREQLEAAGHTVERMWGTANSRECPTLGQFMKEYTEGNYVLMTAAYGQPHSMAIINGGLVDTDLTGTRRRRINVAYRVL